MKHQIESSINIRRWLSVAMVAMGLGATIGATSVDNAYAAGFALKEQSAAAQGNAFAGATAGAEDVTYMFFNPAGLTRHADHQAAIVFSYIIANGETLDADNGIPDDPGARGSGDAALDAFVPAAFAFWSLTADLKLGVGINAPFGLKTKYSQTWAGRYHAVESGMKTVNVNPAVAYRLNDIVSLGAGLQIQYMDIAVSNMVNLGGPDLLAEFTGDDWTFGATLGLLAQLSDRTRLGLGYRSRVRHTIEGDFAIAGALVSQASADFTSPDTMTVGVYHDIDGQWAVMGEVGWTRWSTFDELLIENTDGVISRTPQDWEDVWFFALGATWKPTANWKIRGGIAYDQSPIPDYRRTPRITDENRLGGALGVEFIASSSITISASYAHLFIDDATINLPGLTATYENSYNVLSLQAVFRI